MDKKVVETIGNIIDDSAKATKDKIERAVAKAAAETLSDKKAAAQNTDEFIEKYYRKRFSPATAGKAYLLSFLFDAYSMSERGIQTSLWNLEALKANIHKEEDMRSFDAYYHLTEWLRNLYENSRTMRRALQGTLSDFYYTVTSILAAESIRKLVTISDLAGIIENLPADKIREEINRNPDTLLTLWLNTISLDAYAPQKDGAIKIQALREALGEYLRYIVAYHTFLDVIAEYTGIPECAYLKIKTDTIDEALSSLNTALDLLRKNVKMNRYPEIKENYEKRPPDFFINRLDLEPKLEKLLPSTLTFWTPEYLEATMKYFEPVEKEPPVPEERIQYLRDSIKREFKTGILNWYVLYTKYSINYRIPVPAATPPTGSKAEKIRIKVEAQAEEGK